MCWNLPVTLAFTCVQVFAAALIAWRCKNKRDIAYVILLGVYACMELLQAITWLVFWFDGGWHAFPNDGTYSCSAGSKTMAIVAWTHLNVQPVIWAVCGKVMRPRSSLYHIPIVYSLLTFALNMVKLIVGETTGRDVVDGGWQTNNGLASCVYVGERHHLLWKFGLSEWIGVMAAFPSYYSYLAQALVYTSFYPLQARLVVWFVLVVMFIVSGYSVDWSLETPAVWCWTTVSFGVLCLAEPYADYVVKRLLEYAGLRSTDKGKEIDEGGAQADTMASAA
eukprot:TRINITY_DN13279_c0_g1_i1.p1 TRINITY_DN13279_c0_g1~~TRINITY_DN13279_c0_g1_i1.p1  ORF type:complete len:279 (+),score=52.83 TRINITY_DN13279_c0_g1_i1:132-968(+)